MRSLLRLTILSLWLLCSSWLPDGGGAGGDGGGDGGGGGDGNTDDDDDDDDDEARFTQADLDRIAKKRADKATKAERNRMAAELGMTPEEAAAKIKADKEADDAKLSDADKALKEAEAKNAAATREHADAKRERTLAKLERGLSAAGLPAEGVSEFAPALLNKLDDDADADDIADAIDKFKSGPAAPMFGESSGGRGKPPRSQGGRKRRKSASGSTSSSFEDGAELGKKMFGASS